MHLIELISNLNTLNDELTICAKADPDFHYLSPAVACMVHDGGSIPQQAKGMQTLLEVRSAKEVLKVWKEWRREDKRDNPRPAEACDAIVYYAKNKTYIPTEETRFRINGLVLPHKLQELIKQGRWKTPEIQAFLARIRGNSSNPLTFMNLEQMKRESDYHHLLDLTKKFGKQYGLASSKLTGSPVEDISIIDIDLMVLIAVNSEEETLCLDFRASLDHPRVMADVYQNESRVRWVEITPDFETFTEILIF